MVDALKILKEGVGKRKRLEEGSAGGKNQIREERREGGRRKVREEEREWI